jgi:hypothetical protein
MSDTTDTLVKKRLESVISNYSEEDVEKLRGTFNVEYTVSKNLSKNFFISSNQNINFKIHLVYSFSAVAYRGNKQHGSLPRTGLLQNYELTNNNEQTIKQTMNKQTRRNNK